MLTINSVDCMLRISAGKPKTSKDLQPSGVSANGRGGLHILAPFLKALALSLFPASIGIDFLGIVPIFKLFPLFKDVGCSSHAKLHSLLTPAVVNWTSVAFHFKLS